MRIFITGSSSHLAQALLPMLCADNAVDTVFGLDLHASTFRHHKFSALQADIRQISPPSVLPQYDAFIHLAWVVLRGKMPLQSMREINVSASQHWLATAAELGMSRIIHLSSASVYGQGEHLDENAPLTPIRHFNYAEHKAELERWLIQHYPHVVRLRPHIILGKHAQPLLHRILNLPIYPKLPEPQPLLQCIHEDDVARAIIHALKMPVQGPYNLAAPDDFNLRAAITQNRPHALGIPPTLVKAGLKLLWSTTGFGGEPGWFDGVGHSLTLDCSKAERELGWRAQISAAQMLGAQ
jgi:nucleoside-diphosphate-sugar epimerase